MRNSFVATFEFVTEHADAATVLVLADRSGLAKARERVVADLAEKARAQWRRLGVEVGPSADLVALMVYGMAEPLALRHLGEGLDRDALIEMLTVFTTAGLIGLWNNELRELRALETPPRRRRSSRARRA